MGSSGSICKEDIRRILVVKPSSLGDIIHVFPALLVLRKMFPASEIDFMVNAQFAGLLDYSPVEINRKIIFERKKIGTLYGFLPESLKLIKLLRSRKYDLVVDFQGLFRSGFFSFFAGARFGVCGFRNSREKAAAFFYRHKVGCTCVHAVERNVELLNRMFGVDYPVPECDIPAASGVAMPSGLPENYTVVLPGARWKSKQFPLSLFAGIIRSLLKEERKIVLAGSSDEEDLCRRIIEMCGDHPGIFNCAGKTGMAELFELIRNADSVVCNDSGPLHIASIMNKDIFCFFGPTLPEKTGPWNSRARIYSSNSVCAGCLKRECPLEDTPCYGLDQEKIVKDILNREIIL